MFTVWVHAYLTYYASEAGLGVAEGGWVTSAHYLGYLVGVIVSYTLVTTKQKEQFLMFGLLSSILSTVLMAVTTSFLYWSIIRFFAGLSGAAGVIIGAVLLCNGYSINLIVLHS